MDEYYAAIRRLPGFLRRPLEDLSPRQAQTIHEIHLRSGRPVVLTCAAAIVLAAESHGRSVARWIRRQNFVLRWTLYYAAGAAILCFGAFGQSAFIYQQF